jgi:CysZ protein
MTHLIRKSIADVTRPALRNILLRSVAIAIAILMGLWLLLRHFADQGIETGYGWLDTSLELVTGLGLFVGAIYLIPAVTTLVTGLFLDGIAKAVEKHHYGVAYVGTEMSFVQGLLATIRFTGVVVIANLFALILLFVPLINIVIFLLVNGYLLGREYFELAALRHMDQETCSALRKKHGGRIFVLGLVIAGYLAIPFVNLTTPLFATALMVHYVRKLNTAV